ncbi:MAG: hypothetical protein OQL27_11685 [Sedimenticola sp.]|nr:hypothetical protein [Sedimenticola sp.]
MKHPLQHTLLSAMLTTLLMMGVTPLQASNSGELIGAIFSEIEKRTIEEYYRGRFGKPVSKQKKSGKKNKKQKGLPPGLAKRDSLPPGLAKQLERNGRLPPGLEKRDLPDGLANLLPPRRHGQQRIVVDNDVLLIETATGLILDILRDVF